MDAISGAPLGVVISRGGGNEGGAQLPGVTASASMQDTPGEYALVSLDRLLPNPAVGHSLSNLRATCVFLNGQVHMSEALLLKLIVCNPRFLSYRERILARLSTLALNVGA